MLGSAVVGRGGEAVSVNAATGNLVVSKQDEFLTGRGIDAAISRTYNSLGQTTDRDNGDGWQQSTTQRIFGLNQGSAVQRLGSDGSVVTYVWGIRDDEWAYWTTDGTGAHDKLVESGGNWVWTDGDSQTTETYAISTGSAEEWRIVERKDSDGNALTFTYLAGTDRLSKLTTANGEWMQYSWSGNQITKITTGYTDLGTSTAKTLTRARYTYDGQGRLAQVTVDLSPQNNSITDGKVYSTTYTYDGGSTRVASITQSDGSAVAFRYDAEGRVVRVSQTAAVGDVRVTNLAYQTGYTIVEAPDGKLTLLYHDDKGQLVQIVSADHEDLLTNSRFNGATGWNVWNGQGIAAATTPSTGTVDRRSFAETSFNATTAGQLASIRTDDQHWFDVSAGDLLLVSGTLDGSGPVATLNAHILWLDANNQLIESEFVAGHTATNGLGTAIAKVVEVPAGAVRARYELYMTSSAAGSGSFRLIEPSVVSLSSADVVQFDYDEDGNLLRTIETDGQVLQPGFTGDPGPGGSPPPAVNNLIDLNQWPTNPTSLPGTTSMTGWNGNGLATNSQWTAIADPSGPYGTSIIALTATDAGGGQATPRTALSKDQAYAFSIYVRIDDVPGSDGHRMRIGVDNAGGGVIVGDQGVNNANRFYDGWLKQSSGFVEGRWYKIIGYVLPNGTPTSTTDKYGGIFDTVTGQKAGDVEHYIWTDIAFTYLTGLLFNVYGDNSPSVMTTDFYRPQIVAVDLADALKNVSEFDEVLDEALLTGVTPPPPLPPGDYVDENIANLSLWPDDSANLPASTSMTGWYGNALATNSQWTVLDDPGTAPHIGPYGASVIALTATDAGGGQSTTRASLSKNQAYQFSIYVRIDDVPGSDGHRMRIGVDTAGGAVIVGDTGTNNANRFYDGWLKESNGFVEGRWYKIIGFVLPEGTPASATDKYGGIFDTVTGAKKGDVEHYIWTSAASTYLTGLFFNVYGDTGPSVMTTDFYRPEILAVDMADVDQHYKNVTIFDRALDEDRFLYLEVGPPEGEGEGGGTGDGEGGGAPVIVYDANGRTTRFTYDTRGNIETTTDPLGNVVTYSYDDRNHRVSETRLASDASGAAVSHTTRYVYDSFDHLRFAISPEGRVTEYRYHADGQVHLIIQYPEHVYPLNVSATSEGEMNAWRDGLADRSSTQVRQFIYDARGNLVQSFDYGAASVDGWGVVAEGYEHRYYTYDQAGRLLTQKTMTLNTENFIYDGMGRLIASTDLNGGTTTFAFDDANTTTVVTSAIGLVTTSVYKKMGELLYTRESSTPGDVARFQYDRAGRLKIATNAVGTNRYAVYDGLGRKTADINHLGEIMEYVYDDLDRLVASVRYNSAISGASLLALADPDNELTIDDLRPAAAANDLWRWTVYDANDRVTQTIAGDGSVASYAYDAAGRLVSTVQYANRLTAGQLAGLRADPPAAPVLPTADAARDRVSRTFYDADGAEIGMLDGEGYLTEMVYDGAGRLVREIAYTIATSAALRASGSFDALRASVSPASAAHLNSYYVYDGQGLLRFTIDDAGYVTQNVYWQGVEWSATGLVRETISHATAISTTDFTYDNIKALVAGIANAANDRTASFTYDAAGRLVTSTDPSGLVTTHTYDIAGRTIRSQVGTGSDARITRSFYDDQDRLRFTVDAEGYVDGFDYDPEDRVVAKTRYSAKVAATDSWTLATIGAANKGPVANARVTAYSYDATGRLVSMTDPGGVQTVYAYFANGTKSFEYYAVGADQVATAYQYDTSGRLIAETGAYGTSIAVTTSYSYDGQGNLRTATDPAGYTTSYTYDRRGQMLTQTNALGGIVSYQYDALGNAVKVTDARGNATYSYYDPLNRLKTVRDAENNVVEMRYNAFGETVGVKRYYNKTVSAVSTTTPPVVSADAARDASSYSFYDKLGRLVYSVDAENYVSRNYYNATGDLIRQVRYATTFNAGASTTKADLDAAFGNDQAALPAGAVASSYAHDRLGRVLNSTDARGYQRHYGYDAFDQLTGESNETGGDKLYLYDKRGRLIEEYVEFDDNGNLNSLAITRYQYDARGNRTKMIEGAGLPAEQQRVTEYEYDALNRLIVTRGEARAIASQASHLPVATAFVPTESVAYDSRGLVTRTLDAAGGKATFYYDALGRKVAEINEINAYTAYQYDENGNVKRITVYENPLQVAHPANGGGNPPPPPSGATRVTEFEYDRLDRLVRSSVLLPSAYKTGTLQETSWTNETTASLDTRYQYDAFGNTVKTTDPNGTDQFAFYDRIGRKVAEVDGERYLTRWTYDSRGNVTLEYRFANKVGLQNGLVTQVGTTLQQLVDSALYGLDDRFTGYEYDAVDNRVSETRYNVRLFDPNTNTLGPAGGSYARVEYQYNGLGQVTRKTEATGDDVVYQYDQGGRLLSETRNGFTDFNGVQVSPRVYYTYDTFGNLTRTTAAGSASAADRVTTYQYDAAGMLTRQTDAEGNVHDYYYDALGRQIVDQYYRADSTGSLPATEAVLTGYDALGRVTMQTLARLNGANWAKGDITANEYNTFGDVVRSGLNGLWQTENKYDAAGRLWATNSGDGLWKYLGYDRNGNQTVAITAGGAGANLAGKTFSQAFAVIGNANVNASYTGYDKRNLATAMVEEGRQLGGVTTAITTARTYNSFGDVATETDALGAVTSYTYNTAGKLLRREGPAVSITLENGKQIWVKPSEDYFYDAAGRLVATRDANGSYAETGTSAANATVKNADTGNLTRFTLLAGTGYDGSHALITKQISADGGITRTGFDVHGDARKTEMLIVGSEASGTWRTTTQSYDRLGRLTQVNQAGGLIDYYGYDSLGQRVKHWNNFLVDINGNPDVEQTDYDLQGRVRRTRAFGGDVTTIATSWDAGIAAISGIVTGGWHETTTMANYRTLDEKSDLVGRVVWKQDLGDHDTTYTYDDAGRQVSASMGGLTTSFTYFNTGLVATNSGPAGTASYTYDRNGNRLTEKLVNGSVVKDQTATYDALGRLKTWAENAGSTNPVADMAYEYDANGNIRRTLSHFRNLAETGLPWANATTRDYWFRFDNMNRLVTDKGRLSGTAGAAGTIIVRGTGGDGNNDGRTILYDLAGQRVSTLITTTMLGTRRVFVPDPDPGPGGVQPYAGGHYENQPVYYDGDRREDYAYDGAGQLVAIHVAESGYAVDEFSGEVTVTAPPEVGTLRSIFTYDTLGRMIDQFDKDKAGTNDVYHRRAYYNTKSQLIEEDVSTTKTDGYTYRQVNRFDYGTYGNYALGSVVQSLSNTYRNGSDSDNGDNASRYTFAWYDGAVQAQIQHDKHYDNNHTPGSPGMTQGAVLSGFDTEQYTNFTYNGFGQLTSAYVYDGMPRNVTFTLDELGQIVRRVETRPTNAPSQQAGSPHEAWYRFAGRQMGYTGNNGTSDLSLSASIAERAAASPSTVGTFRNGSTYGLPYADFAQSYDPINSYSQGSAGGSVTVQAGDTLQAIALRLYGDANLWYRIAQANGLSAGAALIEGQSLILPAGTIRSGHSASTFAPYDPAEATGDLSPTAPKPRKKPKCGVFGQILLAAVAIAVTALIKVPVTNFFAGIGGLAGTAVGLAATGAIANIASQAVGVATGIQDRFNWKAVGSAALRSVFAPQSTGNFAADFAFAVVSDAAYQTVAVATGLQSKFDWAGVAAAGVGHAVGGQIAGALGKASTGLGRAARDAASSAAYSLAYAATRSAIAGESFGRNIAASLPNVVAQALYGFGSAGLKGKGGGSDKPTDNAQQRAKQEKTAENARAATDPVVQQPGEQAAGNPVATTAQANQNTVSSVAATSIPSRSGTASELSTVVGSSEQVTMRTDDILKRFGFSGIAQPPATRAATDELAERNIRQIEENPNESAEAKAQAIATVRQAQANAHRRLDQIEATFLGIQYSGIWKGVQDLNPFSFDGWNLSILDGAVLTVGIDGLVVGGKNGVSVTSDGLSIGSSDGLRITSDGLSIGSSDGLRITSNGIFIAGSDGFHITHQGVFIAGNSGLTIAQNRVSVGGYQLFSADVYGTEIDLDVPWDFSQMEPPRLAAESTVPSKLAQGLEFEASGVSRASTEAFLPGKFTRRLSVRAFNADGTLAEGRTVLDIAGYRLDNGEFGALEFKLSPDAPYTAGQKLHYPLLEQNGGVVVGRNGQAIGLRAGARIAPTAPVRVNGPTLPNPGEWWKF